MLIPPQKLHNKDNRNSENRLEAILMRPFHSFHRQSVVEAGRPGWLSSWPVILSEIMQHCLLFSFLLFSSLVSTSPSPLLPTVCPHIYSCWFNPARGLFHHPQFSLIGAPTPRKIKTGLKMQSLGENSGNTDSSTCEFDSYFCEPLGPEEVGVVRNISSGQDCQELCNKQRDCKFFTFLSVRGEGVCSLLIGCSVKQKRCSEKEKCVSGPANCYCQKLLRNPEDSLNTEFARWECYDEGEKVINPYQQNIPLWSTCVAR